MSVHADLFTAFIQRHLPAAINMGIEVVAYDGDTLQCRAPLSLNYNDKLTAFGGSLYVLCVLTCWGMVYLRTRERGIDGDLVVSKGEIEYRAPVAGEFFSAVCEAPAAGEWETFFRTAETHGRARIALASRIDHEGRAAVRFRGEYAIKR